MGLIKPLYFIAKTRRERYPYCGGEFRSGGGQVGISRPAGAGLRASEVVEPERPRGVWGRPSPQYKMKKSLADGPSGSSGPAGDKSASADRPGRELPAAESGGRESRGGVRGGATSASAARPGRDFAPAKS